MPSDQPAHAPTAVWKSDEVKEREEFHLTFKKVKYIAPDFIKSGLFPQNLQEWRHFKLGRIQDQIKEKEGDRKEFAARIEAVERIPLQGRTIKSAFGPRGKVFNNGGGPVLAMPTIWSNEYNKSNAPVADWSTQAELLMHGDNKDMENKRYRSFPPPRAPAEIANQSYYTQPIIEPLPMDEVEPEFTQGPRYFDYVQENMRGLDEDPVFNGAGHVWLCQSLMSIIGPKVYKNFAEEEEKKKEEEIKQPIRQPCYPGKSRLSPKTILKATSPNFVPMANTL